MEIHAEKEKGSYKKKMEWNERMRKEERESSSCRFWDSVRLQALEDSVE